MKTYKEYIELLNEGSLKAVSFKTKNYRAGVDYEVVLGHRVGAHLADAWVGFKNKSTPSRFLFEPDASAKSYYGSELLNDNNFCVLKAYHANNPKNESYFVKMDFTKGKVTFLDKKAMGDSDKPLKWEKVHYDARRFSLYNDKNYIKAKSHIKIIQ